LLKNLLQTGIMCLKLYMEGAMSDKNNSILFLIPLSVIGSGRFRHRGWRQKSDIFPTVA